MNPNHKAPRPSPLWEHINRTYLAGTETEDLRNFKRSGVNFKISLWNPHTNGVRYLKTLIYNLCSNLTEDQWNKLKNTPGRHIGNPLTIRYNGEDVCLDYLQAVWELSFLEDHLPRNIADATILEIGAGYGRTCHTILANHNPAAYFIIDLDQCLALARRYLREVLTDEQWQRIRFIPISRLEAVTGRAFDICINIDSFAEMEAETVRYYLDLIARQGTYFYVKNPVGKYDDPSLSIQRRPEEVELALKTGLLCDMVDINDNLDVQNKSAAFVEVYRPGPHWSCLAQAWAPPWSFYWQALYGRDVICSPP
ncbi:MAG: putative sugar O-methyltransferase [Syntrophales bacterium]|nr:putative sugar O-methyltransferase [Syntrophales bacterium]